MAYNACYDAGRTKLSIQSRTIVHVGAILAAVFLVMNTEGRTEDSWQCRAKPIEPCFKHHGRLSSQNGVALKIWLVGTKRIVALDNDFSDLPPVVQKYLEMTSMDHSYIYGDFDICPTGPDIPGHMRRVCVTDGKNLVVENLQQVRPPFRLLSTWRNTAGPPVKR